MLEWPDTLRLNELRDAGGSGFLSVLELLHDLAANQVRIWLEGDQLRFKAPKNAFTPELRNRLKAAKEEVIAHLRKDLGVRTAEGGIPKADRTQALPLSYAQQRLWFIDQLDPGQPTYNISFCYRIDGLLDAATLEHAYGDVNARHESLRTVFPSVDSQPYQKILAPNAPKMCMVDFSSVEANARETLARDWVTRFVTQPFSLSEGPLVRLAIARLAPRCHLLTVVLHHIIADGWSLDVLLGEWAASYAARLAEREPPLEALPVQYPDFSVWQRQWLDNGEMDRQLKFWEKELAQPREDSKLPADYRRPKTMGHSGDLCFFSVDDNVFAKLRKYRETEGATPFMTFLTAFMILLYRQSGQKDLLVGTPLAQRDRGELENMIGFMVNTLVIRADLGQQPTFEALHRQIQEKTLSSFANADIPFEKLVEEFQPERDPSRNPIIQVMFSMHNKAREDLTLPGCQLIPFDYQVKVAHFDLTMGFQVQDDALAGFIEYSTDLFSAQTIEDLGTRFQRLLAGIAADPKKPIDQYDILGQEEKAALLNGWRSGPSLVQSPQSLVNALRDSAGAKPAQVCVRVGSSCMSFGDLHRRSSIVANGLRQAGLGDGGRVFVDLPFSTDWVVAILGIAKAGGVFVPIGRAWSPKIVGALIDTLTPSFTIGTPNSLIPEVPLQTLAALENGEAILDQGSEDAQRSLGAFVRPDAFGNVNAIFLSEAFALQMGARWQREILPGNGPLGIVSVPSEPAACLALIATIAAGREVVLPSPEDLEGLAQINQWIESSSLQGLMAPLDVVDEYLSHHAGTTELETLIVIDADNSVERRGFSFVEGALKVHHVIGDLARLGWQAMGSREATHSGFQDGTSVVTLSKQDAADFLITDQSDQLVAPGIPGKVWMSDRLAVTNRTALNKSIAGTWCPDPFRGQSGARRMDLDRHGRRLRDGRLAIEMPYRGMVRIGGYSVDMAQLDDLLERHPQVAQAKTNFTKAAGEWSRLETWYRTSHGKELEPEALIAFLQEHQVDLLPGAWHHVDAIILDAHGQVLFERLHGAKLETEVAFGEEPRSPQEWAMAMIWADVLNLPSLKLSDNFFTMGGHSLLAVQILSRVSDVFDQQLPIRVLFEHPTLGGFAAQIAPPVAR